MPFGSIRSRLDLLMVAIEPGMSRLVYILPTRVLGASVGHSEIRAIAFPRSRRLKAPMILQQAPLAKNR